MSSLAVKSWAEFYLSIIFIPWHHTKSLALGVDLFSHASMSVWVEDRTSQNLYHSLTFLFFLLQLQSKVKTKQNFDFAFRNFHRSNISLYYLLLFLYEHLINVHTQCNILIRLCMYLSIVKHHKWRLLDMSIIDDNLIKCSCNQIKYAFINSTILEINHPTSAD